MANKVTIKPVWDMDIGGLPSDDDVNNAAKSNVLAPIGIFSAVPGSTPKYAKNLGEQETDFRETMARMFLQVTDYKAFVNSFEGSPTQDIAAVLGGQASEKTGTTGGAGYIDFLLQSVQHNFQEKAQVVETLADDHVAYFFGQSAPTFSYGGTLINTKQDDQAMNMLRLYRDLGRGSMLASRNTLISIRYDGLIVSGAMMNLSLGLNAETETAVPFSFNLLVKNVLLLPQDYGGLVPLQTQFAAGSDGYLPFSTGALNVNTAMVRPAMTPSAAPVPTASAATEPPAAPPPPDIRGKLRASNIAQSPPPTSGLPSGKPRQGALD
jgi:hypothetical protein